ncbi:GNAT family N-acetyltransferase [Parachlamydia sp. AcF125]|uniref:GNAT family N-acetyltransferase n=1 Tax=Parachlamydia sp. AcF125 TaxID=2795736 RepID=UPI001BC95F2C|nr:GNAT family N-acetyltransferase [Parachlamydia sp. AcF125]MBS4168488.1 hypothetical protein [Parachlamydia sp. AcF125]
MSLAIDILSTPIYSNTYTYSSTHTYRGSSEVSFFVDEHGVLAVTIETERLHIRSVEPSEEDCNSFAALFGDKEVMAKFATGQTKTRQDIEKRIKEVWVKRWHQNNPFSGLAVFKKDTDEFIGHVVIGYGGAAGQAELAYLFRKQYWDQGFGTEAVTALVKEYAPAIIKEGYTLGGKPLEEIRATARPDNPASVKILKKIGMHKIGEEEKFGVLRYRFSLNLREIAKKKLATYRMPKRVA